MVSQPYRKPMPFLERLDALVNGCMGLVHFGLDTVPPQVGESVLLSLTILVLTSKVEASAKRKGTHPKTPYRVSTRRPF